MSDVDSDAYTSADETSSRVSDAIKQCMARKPEYQTTSKSKALRTQLNKLKTGSLKDRQSSRIDSKKKLDDYFRDLAADFSSMSRKFDTICDCISNLFDRLDALEETVTKVSEKLSHPPLPPPPPFHSYAGAAGCPPDGQRLDRLEYASSEEERKKRLLEISLSHPDIDTSNPDLASHVRQFLSVKMHMEPREIDNLLSVRKLPRNNTVLIIFSDKRFKKFIFFAKKRLRQASSDLCTNLYINDNLTTYNYSILKKLKIEKSRRLHENLSSFDRVYSFDGKIYTKMSSNDPHPSAMCISSTRVMHQFFEKLNEASVIASTGASASSSASL